MYEPSTMLLKVLGYWQTLIAGGFAVLAGVLTVWATIRSANREIQAANAQTENAKHLEQFRYTRERLGFLMLLDAALANLKLDHAKVVEEADEEPDRVGSSDRIKRAQIGRAHV